jgi:hypothetical protein
VTQGGGWKCWQTVNHSESRLLLMPVVKFENSFEDKCFIAFIENLSDHVVGLLILQPAEAVIYLKNTLDILQGL